MPMPHCAQAVARFGGICAIAQWAFVVFEQRFNIALDIMAYNTQTMGIRAAMQPGYKPHIYPLCAFMID
jgi:hypothetical protein